MPRFINGRSTVLSQCEKKAIKLNGVQIMLGVGLRLRRQIIPDNKEGPNRLKRLYFSFLSAQIKTSIQSLG